MQALLRVLRFMRPYRRLALAGLALLIATIGTELAVPRLTEYVIDKGITPKDIATILRGSLTMIGVALFGALFAVLMAVFLARISQGMAFDLRNTLFEHIQRLSFGNLDRLQTGQLMSRLSSDVDMVRLFASMGLMMMARAVLMMIGSLVLLFAIDWQLALIMLVLMPAAIVLFWLFAKKARPMFKAVQQKLADLNTIVQENLAGVEVVKAFVRAKYEIERFEERNVDYMQNHIKVGRLLALAFPLILLLANLGTLAVIWLGGVQVIEGQLSVGELVAFNTYVLTTMFPMMMLGMVIGMLSGAVASAERVLEILDTEPLITEAPTGGTHVPVAGRVAFENVTFHYDGTGDDDPCTEEVLRGISFNVEPGQTIALLGATGSGKSTVVNLIPRFYDVTEGRVLIDGMDVRDMTLGSLRSQIGIVLQETTLFTGTVRENIAYGRPDATEEEIVAAAKAAQAHEFIMQMPDGYNSMIEERGANLSGGQKQRLAIARALLINPRILILDDSTSSVDMETEFLIQEALDDLMGNRTSFIIAQRISSVLKADQIMVLDRGQIVACGTHQELMQSSPIYQEIYNSQLNGDRVREAAPVTVQTG